MKSFEEYMKEHCMVDDMDDILCVVAEYLEDKAHELEQNEPYATHTINDLRNAAYNVREIEFD